MKRKKFLNQSVILDFHGKIRKAKIIDVEFETGLRQPLFLLATAWGNKFWMTRRELEDHEVNGV